MAMAMALALAMLTTHHAVIWSLCLIVSRLARASTCTLVEARAVARCTLAT